MKVLHTGTVNIKSGGPALSTHLLLKGLQQQGVDVSIFTYDTPEEDLIGNGVPTIYTSLPKEKRFGFSRSYIQNLRKAGDYDLYHAQGIWQWPTYACCKRARETNKPYMVTLRGMLYPQDLRKSSFIKKISLTVRLRKDLQNAACVHVTCEQEKQYYRELGFTNPVCIIPNPIEIKDYPFSKEDDVFRIGFLGRLHPRKNVEGLIYALDSLVKSELYQSTGRQVELLVIGGNDDNYLNFLQDEARQLGLDEYVRFVGFLGGEEKNKAIASCSILAMPSEFENLGNVILEGLVRRIPCIATKGAPWKKLEEHKCGWWVEYNQKAINQAVFDAFDLSQADLNKMGKNGRELMENEYSVEAVGKSMESIYRGILDGNLSDIIQID